MTRVLGRIDFHLLALAAAGAVADAIAVTGHGVDWYERPAWLFATGFAMAAEWLIAFWWWEKYRHQRGGWAYVVVNQFAVLLLFAGGFAAGLGCLRSGVL